MQINVSDPVQQTAIFSVFLISLLLLTLKKTTPFNFDTGTTNELKGVAVLMILLGHIGYFLSADTRFLWPLSVASGVGVNIFFFLSGFGLTASLSERKKNIADFYRKRFINVYPSLWVVLTVFFILDSLVLARTYDLPYILRSYLGFFREADLWKDINSPLWFITPIVFYYLVYPVIFLKRYPWISALILSAVGYYVSKLNLPIDEDVIKLYKTHYLAFPMGIFSFSVIKSKYFNILLPHINKYVRFFFLLLSASAAAYYSVHSEVGEGVKIEQLTSLLTVGAFAVFFLLKSISSKFLLLCGIYSYEIYLIHWPLLSRYEMLYGHMPAALATAVYILVLFLTGAALKKLTGLIH